MMKIAAGFGSIATAAAGHLLGGLANRRLATVPNNDGRSPFALAGEEVTADAAATRGLSYLGSA